MFKESAENRFHIPSIKIKGYRPFADFSAKLSPLEVIVGANGSGKSSLFEFLKFLRESIYREIPPEIVAGSIGQQIFHRPGPDKFWWCIELDFHQPSTLYYEGELLGPVGRTRGFIPVHYQSWPDCFKKPASEPKF
jgi:predicted ATPase